MLPILHADDQRSPSRSLSLLPDDSEERKSSAPPYRRSNMALGTVPTEILLEIISGVETKSDLLNLSITSRKLHQATQEFLYSEYEDPDSDHRHPYWRQLRPSCKGIKYLLRGLQLTPERGRLFKKVNVTILSEDKDEQVTSLLRFMPRIEDLNVIMRKWDELAQAGHAIRRIQAAGGLLMPEDSIKRGQIAFTNLKSLTLAFGTVYQPTPTPDLSYIILIPTLRNLSLSSANLIDADQFLRCPPRGSAVSSLHLRWPVNGQKTWENFLSRFSRLRNVQIRILLNDDREGQFLRALDMHKTSLQRLSLDSAAHYSIISDNQITFRDYQLTHFSITLGEQSVRTAARDKELPSIHQFLLAVAPGSLSDLGLNFQFNSTEWFRKEMFKKVDWDQLIKKAPFHNLAHVCTQQVEAFRDSRWGETCYGYVERSRDCWFRDGDDGYEH
ncbi:hypothetical protein K504DRAFT_465091 [Pleomassaria siparia CBS 279.74]|uniref:F-box domain-containing protein n=1 Tax=Pleomassaria siparia CBS 279.74 TaxID=1314801 RepID=A0A6G1KFJ9_9PLEO|nr:hypothetical protein K504DRAFT_465091 [Pleomassaria siparia CBS 279.74]